MDVRVAGSVLRDEAASGLRHVLRNTAALTLAYVLPRACTFAAAVVAARALGVATFGEWGSAAALAVILSVTATLGVLPLLVREIACSPERAPQLVGAANLTKLVTTLLMLAATAIIAAGPLGYPPHVTAAALLLAFAYGLGAFAENLGAWFQGIERMEVWMQAQALFGIVTGSLGISLAVTTRDLVWFCLAPVVGQAASLAWLLVRSPPALRTAWTAPLADVRRLLVSLLPFAAAFLVLTAYYKVDIILLGRWRGEGEAGVYAAAYRFVDVAQALSVVVASALYPRLSRLDATRGAPAARTIELMLLAVVPTSALLWIVREPLIALLFGSGYAGAVAALALLAIAIPSLALNALATFVLAAAGRTLSVAGAYGAALVLNVALNATWIPALGAGGAARAMLVSEAALAVVMILAVGRHAGALPRVSALLPALGAAGLAAVIGAAGLRSAVGAGIYMAAVVSMYAATGVIPSAERALLRRALAR